MKIIAYRRVGNRRTSISRKKTVQSCYDVIGKQQIINGIINSAETVFVKSAQKGQSVEI